MPGVNGSSVIGHPGRARVTSSIWAYEWSDDDAAGPSTAEDPSAVLDFAKALHLLVSFVRAGELDHGVEDRGVEMLADGDAPLARLMHAVDLANVQGDFEARTSLLAHAARRIRRAWLDGEGKNATTFRIHCSKCATAPNTVRQCRTGQAGSTESFSSSRALPPPSNLRSRSPSSHSHRAQQA